MEENEQKQKDIYSIYTSEGGDETICNYLSICLSIYLPELKKAKGKQKSTQQQANDHT